jgi:mannose/fructose-specific phosphotransferase system component IIA
MIAGDIKNIQALQLKRGGNPKDLVARIEDEIKLQKSEDFLVFTDLKGGSVHNAMIRLCKYDNVHIIAGFNLGMILEVAFMADSDNIDDAIRGLVEIGRDSIDVFNKNILRDLLKGGVGE